MKNNYLLKTMLFLLFLGLGQGSKANIDTVLVGPNSTMSFSPSNFSIDIGDSILWMWESGFHTTTSTTIPAGATSWDQTMNSTSTSYMYVPAVIGTYNYQCTPHASAGMLGSFTVNSTTGLDEVAEKQTLKIFPNIGNGSFHVENQFKHQKAGLKIYSLEGELIRERTLTKPLESVSMEFEANGVYIIQVNTPEKSYQTKYIKN